MRAVPTVRRPDEGVCRDEPGGAFGIDEPGGVSKGLRDQELFDEHARFLDGLVDEGFIILGGPLDERDVLLVVQGETEAAVRSRFAADPWIENGMLTLTAIRPWTIFLEGRL
jgi:uncharacterized protein YciI